jgi:hypothetical protein
LHIYLAFGSGHLFLLSIATSFEKICHVIAIVMGKDAADRFHRVPAPTALSCRSKGNRNKCELTSKWCYDPLGKKIGKKWCKISPIPELIPAKQLFCLSPIKEKGGIGTKRRKRRKMSSAAHTNILLRDEGTSADTAPLVLVK